MSSLLSLADAALLGVVEGLTEFLPVSSTGHLILVSTWLDLYHDPATKAAIDAFEIVIQCGALLAVLGLYAPQVRAMLAGLLGRDAAGRKLLLQLLCGLVPAVVVGLLAGSWIKRHLFGTGPVIIALAVGGLLMIVIERLLRRRLSAAPERGLEEMDLRGAFIVGCAQCLAMWPGTSRSMVTIMAGRLLGFQPRAAAEFSFLLALPTLGAATVHELMGEGPQLLHVIGIPQLAVGLAVSCLVAWLAMKGFLAYLNRHGMELFGWYRLALAAVLLWIGNGL